ncbi:MAG: hypothetical protein K2F90_06580 [Clostridiales bacterium]|nr:hypothetical protein [Clostridiales bacterium]
MQEQEIKNYILAQSEIEFPALQKQFSLSYIEAKAIVVGLENVGKLRYKSGVTYAVLSQPSDGNQPEYAPKDGFEVKCIEALWWCIEEHAASSALVQRKCQVGFAKAMGIMEWLEKNGYITPYPDRRPLITKEQYWAKFGKRTWCDESNEESAPASRSLQDYFKTFKETDEDGDDDGILDVDKEIAKFMKSVEGDEPEVPDIETVLNENIARDIKKTTSGSYVWELNGAFDIWFEYIRESNIVRISDEGSAFLETHLSDRRIKNAIKKFPQVQYGDNKVFIDVLKPSDTFKGVFALYSALDYLFKLE